MIHHYTFNRQELFASASKIEQRFSKLETQNTDSSIDSLINERYTK
jgi:hypothetical protein